MSFNDKFKLYRNLLKTAEGNETFSDKPSNEKTEKDKAEDKSKNDQPPEQQEDNGNEVVGQATQQMQPPVPEGAESPIYEVLGPSIFQAASMGDENAKDVIARTAAEIVKSMMGMGGVQNGMQGPPQQNPYMMQPQTPEQQVANNIVPPSIPPTMQPQYQNPAGVYTQAMQ